MSLVFPDKIRRVVPRWRDFRTAQTLGELASHRERPTRTFINEVFLAQKVTAWQSNRSVATAAEVVTAGLVMGRQDEANVRDAASFLLKKGTPATLSVRDIAYQILHRPDVLTTEPRELSTVQLRTLIHAYRQRLGDSPRNPFIWADLSRLYSVLAHVPQSLRAMDVAMRLAPTNRFILRSAARLFVHANLPDAAHDLLRSSKATPSDPWLLSAEIAVASVADRSPMFIRQARHALESGNYAPWHLTELASALATQELLEGSPRRARQLFRRSLSDPTENSVAQAEWASKEVSGLVVEESLLETPRSFEAGALKAFHGGDWKSSIQHCERWLLDEAFSKRPAVMASYIAITVTEEYSLAEAFARRGLEANRDDALLKNNLVVALANQGSTSEARAIFSTISRPSSERLLEATFTATEGLLRYRVGDSKTGKLLYRSALQQIGTLDQRARALAMVHLAREEVLARSPRAIEEFRRAETEIKGEWPEVRAMLDHLRLLTSGPGDEVIRTKLETQSLLDHLAATKVEREDSYRRLREGLGDRSWLVEEAVSAPFGVEAVFQNEMAVEDLARRLATHENDLSIDITDVASVSRNVNLERVTFLGVYPSGVVRGISAKLRRQADRLKLTFEAPIALVDPESPFDSVPRSGLRCDVTLLGLELPPYGG